MRKKLTSLLLVLCMVLTLLPVTAFAADAVAITLDTENLVAGAVMPQAATEANGITLTTKWTQTADAENQEVSDAEAKEANGSATFEAAGTYTATITVTGAAGDAAFTLNGVETALTDGALSLEGVDVVAGYIIKFAAGEGASGDMASASVPKNTTESEATTYALPECGFTAPEGKEFDAWTVTDPNEGATITDGTLTIADTVETTQAITLTATWKDAPAEKYAITISSVDEAEGSVTADATEAAADDTVTLTVTAAEGYEVEAVTAAETDNAENAVTVTKGEDGKYTFTMPAAAVTVTATFTETAATKYAVTISGVDESEGSVTADVTEAAADDTVTLTVTAAEGYEVEAVTAAETDNAENAVTVTKGEDGKYTFTMPAAAVTVTATFKAIPKYAISIGTIDESEGSVTADVTEAAAGDTVTLTVTAAEGYVVSAVTATEDEAPNNTHAATHVSGDTYSFTMPAAAVTVTATFRSNDAQTYAVGIDPATNGSVTADMTEAAEGDTVTLTVTAEQGYEIEDVVVTNDEDDSDVAVSTDADGVYTFTMPAAAVTVTATFTETVEEDIPLSSVEITLIPAGTVIKVGDSLPNASTTTEGVTLTTVWSPAETTAAGTYTAAITIKAEAGYTLTGATCTVDGKATEATSEEFTVNKSIEVEAAAEEKFDVTVEVTPSAGGSAEAQVDGVKVVKAGEGDEVTVVIEPNEGYEIASVTFDGASVNWDDADNYVFTMPGVPVTLTVTFKESEGGDEPDVPGESDGTVDAAVDVTPTVEGGTASATVNESTVTAAIDKAIEDAIKNNPNLDEDSNIEVEVVTITATSNETVDTAQVTLSEAAVKQLAAVSTVTIETNVGKVSLPQEVLADQNQALTLVVAEVESTADVSGADAEKIVATYDVSVKDAQNVEIPISNLKTPIVLEFNIGTDHDPETMLAYVDNGAIKKITSAHYNKTTGIITGTISHLTEIVAVTPDLISDYYVITGTTNGTGGAGKTLVVNLNGNYNGTQVVTLAITYKNADGTQTVNALTQNVNAGNQQVTFSYNGNPEKIDIYVSSGLPNLADKELGVEIYDSVTEN